MIDPFTLAQTHPSLETRPPVQTHTMLEKTAPCQIEWREGVQLKVLVIFHAAFLCQ